jgi:hypothetical protein
MKRMNAITRHVLLSPLGLLALALSASSVVAGLVVLVLR